jgi:hypothetical protein
VNTSDHWFTAIYQNRLIEFKVPSKYGVDLDNTLIVHKDGTEQTISLHDCTFGERWWLEKVLDGANSPEYFNAT